MKVVHHLVLFVCLAAAVPGPASARAGVVTFEASSGNWEEANNWSSYPDLPQPGDRVVIPATHSCFLGSGNPTVDTVEVEGNLDIGAGQTLTLTNTHDNVSGTPDNSLIDGTLTLEGGTGGGLGGAIHITSAWHTFAGGGSVHGGNNSTILVTGYNRLTNQLATTGRGIRGAGLTIDGALSLSPQPPSFENQGVVAAVNGFSVTLGSSLLLLDIPGAEWSIESSGSTVQFYKAAALSGDFKGMPCARTSGGTFRFYETVTTCGTFTRNGCAISINGSGTAFQYQYFDPGNAACGDPGSTVTGTLCAPTHSGHSVDSDAAGCGC